MILALVLSVAIGADDNWIADYAKDAKAKATTSLTEHKKDLSAAKSGKIKARHSGDAKTDKGFVFRNVNEKRTTVATLEGMILRTNKFLTGVVYPFPDGLLPSAGIGTIANARVLQVISPDSAIVDAPYFESYVVKGQFAPKTRLASRYVWLDAPTAGWVDNQSVDFSTPAVVIGTKKYIANDGLSTVPHLRLLTQKDLDEYKKVFSAK